MLNPAGGVRVHSFNNPLCYQRRRDSLETCLEGAVAEASD